MYKLAKTSALLVTFPWLVWTAQQHFWHAIQNTIRLGTTGVIFYCRCLRRRRLLKVLKHFRHAFWRATWCCCSKTWGCIQRCTGYGTIAVGVYKCYLSCHQIRLRSGKMSYLWSTWCLKWTHAIVRIPGSYLSHGLELSTMDPGRACCCAFSWMGWPSSTFPLISFDILSAWQCAKDSFGTCRKWTPVYSSQNRKQL